MAVGRYVVAVGIQATEIAVPEESFCASDRKIRVQVLMAADFVSLLLDTVEVIRCIRGEREETVQGLRTQ